MGTPLKFGWNRGGVALIRRKPAISLKRSKIGPKLLLMTNRKSHMFSICAKITTLDNHKGHYALGFKTHATFGAHDENLNKDRPTYYQRRRCSPVTLDSGNIWFMQGVKRHNRKRRFSGLPNADFSTLVNEANII